MNFLFDNNLSVHFICLYDSMLSRPVVFSREKMILVKRYFFMIVHYGSLCLTPSEKNNQTFFLHFVDFLNSFKGRAYLLSSCFTFTLG